MSQDEFEIVSIIDQPIPLKMEKTLFDKIDAMLERSIEEKDPCIALSMGNTILGAVRIGGLGLAKIFHTVKNRWRDYEYEGTLYELAEQELGILAKATVDRYIAVWEMLSGGYIPQDVMEYVRAKPMRQLVPMASLISQGFDVKQEEWVKLAHAADAGEVGEIVREIKGKPAKKSSLKIMLEDDGDLKVYQGKTMKSIGWLNVGDKDETVKKAIDRICENSGIVRR